MLWLFRIDTDYQSTCTISRWAGDCVAKRCKVADQCLAVYGVDFVLDKDLNPWILEVQPGPNMQPTCQQEWPVRASLAQGINQLVQQGQSQLFEELHVPEIALNSEALKPGWTL